MSRLIGKFDYTVYGLVGLFSYPHFPDSPAQFMRSKTLYPSKEVALAEAPQWIASLTDPTKGIYMMHLIQAPTVEEYTLVVDDA